MRERQNDKELSEKLAGLSGLMGQHGPRSEQVRQYIRENRGIANGRFKNLAFTSIVLYESRFGRAKPENNFYNA